MANCFWAQFCNTESHTDAKMRWWPAVDGRFNPSPEVSFVLSTALIPATCQKCYWSLGTSDEKLGSTGWGVEWGGERRRGGKGY